MEELKLKYPRVENFMHNDAIQFLITGAAPILENISEEVKGVSAMVVPRDPIGPFRDILLDTFKTQNYRSSNLYLFKLLYRFAVFDVDGHPMPVGWDLSMDHTVLKKSDLTDFDRKIIMPSSWVISALHCQKMEKRRKLLEKGLNDSGFHLFQDFPAFLLRD
jgi:hypothetical protein